MAGTAVIINEFGEIGLDHDLVEAGSEDGVIELSAGCLCCTVRGDLARRCTICTGACVRKKSGRSGAS